MQYIKHTIYLLITFTFISGCMGNTKDNATEKSEPITTSEAVQTSGISLANEKWMEYINGKSDSISKMYDEHAIRIFEDGNTIVGKEPIKDHYQKGSFSIQSMKTDIVIMANQKRGLEYEIGEYTDEDDSKYKHIIIWETKNESPKRVFEVTAQIEKTDNELAVIDDRRKLWMELCNKHNAEALINEMYSKNTLYFNHKPLITGRESLVKEYSYMNNEKYELSLNPIIVEQINKNFVFEIGQCKGSYNGKYIIVWRKEESGKWEVFIDSNI